MDDFSLECISPIDGRYRETTEMLQEYFSEKALIKYRLRIEIEYFFELCCVIPELKELNNVGFFKKLFDIFENFDANEVKQIEKTINHDVKAIEYYIKKRFAEIFGDNRYANYIHFGLTSQDINNTALPLLIKNSVETVFLPFLKNLKTTLLRLSEKWIGITMLSLTHGQPASPTKLGKEIRVFVERINAQIESIKNIDYYAKFGGAVGNFNAHVVAYPDINWIKFSDSFIKKYGLKRHQYTTQIDHYDSLCALFDNFKRLNNVLVDLNQDIWLYISNEVFKLKINKNEVGSSTMPHKVNPINFENSEANLKIANTLFEFFSRKLPVSRLQRDLTDSSVCRNIGVAFSHSLIGYTSLLKGLDKLEANTEKIKETLDRNWVVVSEAIVSVLKKNNFKDPYEKLKEFTRINAVINKEFIQSFIDTLDVDEKIKKVLYTITPENYTGYYRN